MKKNYTPNSASKFIISLAILFGGLWGFGSGGVLGQKIIYVDSAAAPGGNGLSWATAFNTLDPALDTMVYDSGDQVWVAEGTYYPDSLYSGIGLNPRNRTFIMRSGLKIFGGFDSGAISLAQRDFINNRTILSGDIGVKNDTTDNSFSVVYAWFTDTSAWLDGFIITKGRATDGVSTGFVNGGGIYCPDHLLTTGATIRNCTITDNVASSNGGGVFIWQNNVSFYNCTFSQNKANEGGAVFTGNQASGEFIGCVFSQNTAGSFGGGVAVRGATNTFINDIFILNNASNGGGLYVDGGGSPYIANLTIQGNTATNNGGGYYIASLAQVTINNNLISGNYADNQGGGVYAQDAGTNVYVINSTVSGNYADDEGGGFYQTSVLFFIRNCIVHGNTHTANTNPYANQLSGNIFFPNHSLIQGIATPSGSSNLNADPLFLAPIVSSLAPAVGGDYRVSKYSLVINAGNNSNLTFDTKDIDNDQNTLEFLPLDLQNMERIENTTVDMGAYETLDICKPLGNSKLLFSSDSLQFCEGDTILITTLPGFTNYLWSFNGQVVVPPANELTVDTTGKVIIRLSDTTGCSTTDSLESMEEPLPQPQVVASSTPLCLGDSVDLTTSVPYPNYLWSTGSVADTLTIGIGGKYWVDITDSNGCSNADTILVTDVPKPTLTLTPSDSLSLCDGDSVLLKASGNFISYAWSTGEVTDSIWVDIGGLFIVAATDNNGCVVVDTIEVTLLPTPTANIVPNGPLEFCDGDSVGLDAGNHAQYAWSTGATSRLVTIKQSDSVFVTVTNTAGCTDSDSTIVKVNPLPNSTIFFANDTVFCQGDSILLSVNNNYSNYAWSNGDTTFATVVKTTGLVTVLITDSNNCSSTGQINTLASPLPQPQIQAAGGSTSFCQGGSVLLGLGSGDFATVLWENDSTGTRTNATVGGYFTVDVTDSLGCAGSDSILITVFPNPTPTITPGGIVELCQGDTVFLDAGTYANYTWFLSNTPIANTQILATDSAGNYSVRVTDANSCTGTDLVRVDVNPKPVITHIDTSGPTTFCNGDSVTLDAGVFTRYRWSTGATSRTITVKRSGTYKVLVFNSFNCVDSASISVTVNPNPVATINPLGSTTICFGDSLRLDGGFHSQYRWSTGDTTSFIWVKTGGQFILEVTNVFGCTDTDTITTVLGPVLNPQISLSGSSTLCDGDSLILFAGVFPAYRWSTGETSQFITVKQGGQYWVEVSVPIGCSGSDTVAINLVNNPTVSILPLGPTTFCDEDSVVLDADAFEAYDWSTGDTTRFLTVDTSGLFYVTVTDTNNCQASDSMNTSVLPKPTALISPGGPTTVCDGDSVSLDAGMHDSYLWSTGDTTSSIMVDSTANYLVTVTNSFNCTDTSSINVTILQNPEPNIIASNTTIFCEGDSVTLDAGSYADIKWYQDGMLIDSSQLIKAKDDAEYAVVVTDSSGCVGDDTVFVTVNPLPQPNIVPLSHASPDFCDGDQITIGISVFPSISWSTGAGSPVIFLDSSQLVSVVVTDANNCTGFDSLTVTEHPIPEPNILASPDSLICVGDTATLDAGVFNFYRWNDSPVDTARFIQVDTTGIYYVRVLNDFCLGYDTIFVQVSANPVLNITPDTLTEICENVPLTITSGVHDSYLWSTGDTTQSINVDSSAVYTLTVTESTGCLASDSVEIIAFQEPKPIIQANGPLVFCDGDSVQLWVAGGAASYNWSNGDTDTLITVNVGGWYWVDVTDVEGCVGRDSIFVTVNPLPTVNITPPGPTSICLGTSITLDAGSQQAGSVFLWSINANTRTISVNSTGQYWVEVTNLQGCKASDSTFIIASQTIFPTIMSSQPIPICQGQSVVLDAGPYQSYLWTPGLATTRQITVSQPGTYSVQVTDANGCRGDDQITVTVAQPPIPSIVALNDTIFCDGDSVVLDGGNFPFHFWNTTEISRQIVARTTGDYSVTVVDNNNCSAADTITVLVKSVPQINLTANPPAPVCEGDSVFLDANGAQPQYTYSWNTSATTEEIWVKTTGVYTVTVSDTNACSISDSIPVTVYPTPTPAIISSGPLNFCDGDSVTLDGGEYALWDWSTGDTTRMIVVNTSGVFRVTVSDSNGCQKADSVTITVFPLPIVSIGPADTLIGCVGDTLIADGGALPNYLWNTGDTGRFLEIISGGWYFLESTTPDGCKAKDSVFVIFNPLPVVNIQAPDTCICTGGTMLLEANSGLTSYVWSTGDTTSQILIDTSGIFSVVVKDQNGCKNSDTVAIAPKPLIPISIQAINDTVICQGDTAFLTTDTTLSSYLWSNGDTSRSSFATTTGWVGIIVRDADGCFGTDSIFIQVNAKPVVTLTPAGPTTFCNGDSVLINAGAGFASYQWSNGDTTASSYARTNGSISVFVEDLNGCRDTADLSISVFPLPNPNIVVNGPTSLCFGDQVTLVGDTGYVNYSWIVSGNVISTNPSITVDSGALYVLQVEDQNGCIGSNSIQITVGSQLNPQINGDSLLCPGQQANLFVGSFSRYLWKEVGRNDTISQSSSVIVTQTGSYWIEVRDNLGCSGRDTFDVFFAPPINLAITANGPTTICAGDSVQLSTNQPYSSYDWGTGDTTRSIWVRPNQTRAYVVTVTDQYGCSADTFRSVIVNPRPNLNVLTNLAPPYCQGDSVTLFAGSFPNVSWTRRSDGALLSNDTVLTIGREDWYRVTVSTAQSCSESDSIFIQFNQNPTPTIFSSGKDSLLCSGDTISLSVNQYDAYSWTGGSTDSLLQVFIPQKYIVEVTDGNGCKGQDSINITQVALPIPNLPDTIETCEDRSIVLDPGIFALNVWNTGDTVQSLLVDTAGLYVVTVTDSNMCHGKDSSFVIELPIPTVVVTTSTGSNIACSADSMILDAGAGYLRYNWLGYPDSTRLFRPTTTGQYLVAVTDSNGCEGLGSINVIISQSPTASFTGLDSTYCENGSRDTLFGTPAGGVFRGPGIVNSGGLTFFVPALASTGTVNIIEYIFTDPVNGCPDTARQAVTVIPVNATPAITGIADSVCANDLPFLLQAINQNNGQPIAGGSFSGTGVTGPNSQGQWSFDPSLVSPGQGYSIVYSFNAGFGCAASAQKTVYVKQIPSINIVGLPDTLCSNGATEIFFGDAPGAAVFSGPGVFGIDDTSAFFRPSTLSAGVYAVNYIHPNQGCVSRISQNVIIVAPVQPVLGYTDSTFCSNEQDFSLSANPSGGIFRITSPGCGSISGGNIFSPSSVPSMCIGLPINVVYEVTDANGCITDVRDTIKVYQAPTVSLLGLDTLYCIDQAADTLQGSPSGGVFSGPGASSVGGTTPIFTPPLAGAGRHRLVFYYQDSVGCADSVISSVRIDPPAVITFDPLDSAFCHNEASSTLRALPAGGVFSGMGIDSMTNVFDPSLVKPGDTIMAQYRYTNPLTGCVDIGRTSIKVDTVPSASIDTLLDFFHCRERDPIVLNSTPVAPPGVFSGRTIQPPNFFDPDGRTLNFSGRDTIIFSYTDAKGCTGTDSTIVDIVPRDSVYIQNFPQDTVASYCYASPVQTFTGQPAGGTFVTELGDTLVGGQLLPSDLPPDSVIYLYYIYDDGIGCLDSTFTQLRVRKSLEPEIIGFDSVYCRNSVEIPIQGLPRGGVRSASDPGVVIDGSFYPSFVSRDSNQVTLYYTVTNSAGCKEVARKTITLRDTVSSSIIEDGGGFCEGSDPVQLRGLPAGGWFIGDAIVDSTGIFDPDSAQSGPNLIYYEVDDPIGCRSRTRATIFIKPEPILTIFPEDGAPFTCVDRFIGFTAEASDEFGNPLTDSVLFAWDYENGQNSQGVTGSTFYSESGLYDVRLHADFTGCTSDTTLTVFVYANPEPAFIGDTAIFLGDTANFFNQTPDADRYTWRFGDGSITNTFDAKYRYDSLGAFNVVLKAIKEYTALPNPEDGCFATTQGLITVTRRPKSEYELTVYPNPTTGTLLVNLELQEADDVVLTLYDERGRVVEQELYPDRPEGFQKLTFKTENLTEGTYILAVVAGEDLIELGGYKPGVVGPFGLRYNNRRKIVIQR